jgi:hypothetical protein
LDAGCLGNGIAEVHPPERIEMFARSVVVACALLAAITLFPSPPVVAATAKVVHVTKTSSWPTPSNDPRGIAYDRRAHRLLVSDSEADEAAGASWNHKNLFISTRVGRLVAARSLAKATVEPEDVAWDGWTKSLYVVDDDTRRVYRFRAGTDRRLGTGDDFVSTVVRTRRFGSYQPQGLDFVRHPRMLIVTDSVGGRVYELRPGKDGQFGSPDDVVLRFSTKARGFRYPTDVAFDRRTHNLFIVGPMENVILQTTLHGRVVRRIDLSGTGILNASGITFAPGPYGGKHRIYIADCGRDDSLHPGSRDGQIVVLKVGA